MERKNKTKTTGVDILIPDYIKFDMKSTKRDEE